MNVIVEKKKRKDYLEIAGKMDFVNAIYIISHIDEYMDRPEMVYIAKAYLQGYESAMKFTAELDDTGKTDIFELMKEDENDDISKVSKIQKFKERLMGEG